MIVPTGIEASGIALPGFTSALVVGNDLVATGQTLRRQDVGQIAVFVCDQRNERGPVGIVFETLHRRLNAKLLAALEIDDAVGALVTAAATTRP
jgi:hypothetical protein